MDTCNTKSEEQKQPVSIIAKEVHRFDSDDPALKDFLICNGFVVVKSVLDSSSVELAKKQLWRFLDDAAGIKHNDMTTWTLENLDKVGLSDNGILCKKGIGQTEFMWHIRQLPRVKSAFSNIYGTDDLLSSMDGGNIYFPWHRDTASHHQKTETGWYHVDQGLNMRGFQCVQGLVSLTEVSAGTGGLCLIPGSPTFHDEVVELTGVENNYVKVPGSFHALRHQQILPLCHAGDMILWDSRTIHCSTPALVAPTASPDELLRIAAYVCMTPRKLATAEVIDNRVQAYMRDMTLHHWPHVITHQIEESNPIVRQIADAPPLIQTLIGVGQVSELS